MDNQIFFIQLDNNNNVSKITHNNHLNDNNWYMAFVDRQHLNGFENDYNQVKYDKKNAALIYPDDFEIENTMDNNNESSIKKITNEIAQIQNDQTNLKNNMSKLSGLDNIKKKLQELEGSVPSAPKLTANMKPSTGVISYNINQPSNKRSSNVFQYHIYYKVNTDSDYQMFTNESNSGNINNLDGHKKYNIYVVAENAAGLSPQSNIITTAVIDKSIYGVKWDRGSDPNLTRTDAAVGMSTDDNGHNDFDDNSVWNLMHQVSDNEGHTFIRIPKCYIRKTQTGSENSGECSWQVSLAPFPGAYLPKCFIDYDNNNNVLPYIDISTGTNDLGSDTIDNLRSKAQQMGKGYQLIDVHIVDVLQTISIIENATLNETNLSNYRGISNFIVDGFVDGVNFNNGQIWVCDNPTNYQSNTFANPYYQIGYSRNNSGYGQISSMNFDSNNPDIQFPTGLNGGDYNYYCSGYISVSGVSVAALHDVWYFYLRYNTSNTDSSRLIKRPVG